MDNELLDPPPQKKRKKAVYSQLNRSANKRWRNSKKMKMFTILLNEEQHTEAQEIANLTKCQTNKEAFLLIFRAYRDMVARWK